MTVKELWKVLEISEEDGKQCMYIYDKTGNIKLGCFYKRKDATIPDYFNYIDVETFKIGYDSIYIRVKDFVGDLTLKKPYQENAILYRGVTVKGFDFEKVGGFFGDFVPSFVNIDNGDKVTKVKLKDTYYFNYKGIKYSLSNVRRR
ncbi:MAG: hypothetical protein J6S67_15100 [Methanobrevibacter sp.]|nr:hypothetical protein [Methanobrevibacter sp.]